MCSLSRNPTFQFLIHFKNNFMFQHLMRRSAPLQTLAQPVPVIPGRVRRTNPLLLWRRASEVMGYTLQRKSCQANSFASIWASSPRNRKSAAQAVFRSLRCSVLRAQRSTLTHQSMATRRASSTEHGQILALPCRAGDPWAAFGHPQSTLWPFRTSGLVKRLHWSIKRLFFQRRVY